MQYVNDMSTETKAHSRRFPLSEILEFHRCVHSCMTSSEIDGIRVFYSKNKYH